LFKRELLENRLKKTYVLPKYRSNLRINKALWSFYIDSKPNPTALVEKEQKEIPPDSLQTPKLRTFWPRAQTLEAWQELISMALRRPWALPKSGMDRAFDLQTKTTVLS
jgi:hypothetical protein